MNSAIKKFNAKNYKKININLIIKNMFNFENPIQNFNNKNRKNSECCLLIIWNNFFRSWENFVPV